MTCGFVTRVAKGVVVAAPKWLFFSEIGTGRLFANGPRIMRILTLLAAGLVVAGCHHKDAPANDPGPMQKAGSAVDHAAGNVKDAAKDTGSDVKNDLSK